MLKVGKVDEWDFSVLCKVRLLKEHPPPPFLYCTLERRNWPWLWLHRNIHRKSGHWFAKIIGQDWTGRCFCFGKPSQSSGASLFRFSLFKQYEKWRRTTDQRHDSALSESVYSRGKTKDFCLFCKKHHLPISVQLLSTLHRWHAAKLRPHRPKSLFSILGWIAFDSLRCCCFCFLACCTEVTFRCSANLQHFIVPNGFILEVGMQTPKKKKLLRVCSSWMSSQVGSSYNLFPATIWCESAEQEQGLWSKS